MTTTKTPPRFNHLHTHTEYSMLDGISRIPQLVDQAKSLGMDSLAITDHGGMYGVIDFYKACKEAEIKPVIGCEVYVAKKSRFDKTQDERSPHHLVLLARDNQGYRNLMQLVTKSHTEGFHYKPRIDRELLTQYNQGLIALSGCASAEVPRLIAAQTMQEATAAARWYKDLLGDAYFLELQRHQHVENLDRINEGLADLSTQLDIPLVVTNDAHYVHQEDAPLQDIYICIQTGTTINDEKRLRMEDPSYYIKTQAEMADLFPDFPQALVNTGLIADMSNVSLDFGQTHLPKYPLPDGVTADEYLSNLCWDGLREKYPHAPAEAVKRLEYELDVIRHTSFANYFLVVWDIIKFVRQREILYGVRGSAAASVALHCLNITSAEPLQYKLVFERFLNMERKEMPDIDMDFQDDRRDEVLHYVIDKYGNDKVAQIITFGTLGAKAALRDAGRALGMSYGDVDRIAKMVPFKAKTIADALQVNPDFKNTFESEPDAQKLVETAQGLEGIVHHVSTHPAGVLISEDPLTGTVPLQRPSKGDENSPVLMTQYSMDPVAKLGLLKMDFLGLTNLTILDRAVKLVHQNRGISIDLETMPLDDPDTFRLLSSGNTTDIFQLESGGMRRYIKELQPSDLGDIAAMIALYRPGPMENIDTFINSKFGRAPITYPHPSFKEFLDETYGVVVYQDQVLLILQQFAGYTLGGADIVRKAMGKKIPSLMAAEREKFVSGATGNGYEADLAGKVFDLIEPFAGYAFNKAHSISYALISYWTAYFKTHHPLEYMTAVLDSRIGNPDKMAASIKECLHLGLQVLPPDINRSGERFTIDETAPGQQAIRTGLMAVKTVGETAVAPLVQDRKAGPPFTSIDDFCRKANTSGLNRRTLENLVKAGAFDSLAPRGAVLAALDQIISLAQNETKNRASGQTSLFGDLPQETNPAMAAMAAMAAIDLSCPDAAQEHKTLWEQDLMGIALSDLQRGPDPSPDFPIPHSPTAINSLSLITDELKGETISVLGYVSEVRERQTKDNKTFLIAELQMLGGPLDVMLWPSNLPQYRHLFTEQAALRVTGPIQLRNDRFTLTCTEAREHREGEPEQDATAQEGEQTTHADELHLTDPTHRTVALRFVETPDTESDTHLLREAITILLQYKGEDQVNLEIATAAQGTVLLTMPMVTTHCCDELEERLDALLGQDSVTLTGAAAPAPPIQQPEPEPVAAD